MNGQVTQLGQDPDGESSVDLNVAKEGSSVLRVIDIVSNEESESPVITAVFKQIEDGHRRVRETMDEECLQQSLGIMNGPTNGCNVNNGSNGSIWSCFAVN